MLCKTRRKDPTLSHNIGDFTTFNGSQSSAYAKEMLKTERYRFLFYAKKSSKIQQFTHVQRHWEKIRPIFQKYLICSYLILPCSHRALFHNFSPIQIKYSYHENLAGPTKKYPFFNCVMTAVLTTCTHYRKIRDYLGYFLRLRFRGE